jgi:hypothetical protein
MHDAVKMQQSYAKSSFPQTQAPLLKSRLHRPLTTLGPSAKVMPPGGHATFVECGVNPAVVVPQQTLRLPR